MPCTVGGRRNCESERVNLHCAIAHQRALVEQRLHHLLDEERIALGALDNQSLECFEFHASTEQRRQHCRAIFAAEGVEPELQVVAPARPFMAVLRTVVDQQQHARVGDAVGEQVEQRLGLGVDPMKVLEDHHQRVLQRLA